MVVFQTTLKISELAPVPDKPLRAVFRSPVSVHAEPFQDSVFPFIAGSSPPTKRADV